MEEVTKKRRDLTIKEKAAILEDYDKLPKMIQRRAAAQLNISQPVLCKLLKNRSHIENEARTKNHNYKRKRTGKDSQVETSLKEWFVNISELDICVDGPMMRKKAEEIAKEMGKEDFVATDGWFSRWKKRENIVYKRSNGKQNDSNFLVAEVWLEKEWPKIIAEFSPNNIYSAHETGLYYNTLFEGTSMCMNKNAGDSEAHVTILCCVSMSGNKKKLLVIGKSMKPQCFKDVKRLPVDYYSNSNVWMTIPIFNDWLRKWDNALTHNIVLLIDSCSAHTINVSLQHIEVIFLPLNMTTLIQPCNQGISQTLKICYRKEMLARILENGEDMQQSDVDSLSTTVNFLDILHLLAMAWENLSKKFIQNCFKNIICSKKVNQMELGVETPMDIALGDFQAWMTVDESIPITSPNSEFVDVKQDIERNEEEEVETAKIEKPPTNAEMRAALQILRRSVQRKADEFHKQYEYEQFINELLRKE